jgi:hypothetical protein
MDLALTLQPLVALVFAIGFIAIYSLYGKWWKTSIGRHMIGFMAGCAVVLTLAILSRFFPWMRESDQLRFWAWNIVISLFAWRFWVAAQVWLLRNQRDLRRIREDEEESTHAYVFDILDAWTTGEQLDFHGNKVPSDVRLYLEREFGKR